MLFNSYIFIFVFLPVVLAGYYLIGRSGRPLWAWIWLTCASIFFYGFRNPACVAVLLFSVVFNYGCGLLVARRSKSLLSLGIAANLVFLGYFKYTHFFLENIRAAVGVQLNLEPVVLPLAISFFTFSQISYLVDVYRGTVREEGFLNYCLYVSFFPKLMQGPIVYSSEIMPQFVSKDILRFNPQNLAVGMTIFFFGLFKKVIFADGLALYATPVFEAARLSYPLSFLEAWEGALSYTLQIYFDFSGYSDMAIGLALLFGVRLPINFHSPYQSLSIIDFWRRWHISLSRFLRDFIYIPLGGNRKGEGMRYVNIMITMLLGGLWHGAAWTFVLWGGMHGLLLVINHGWIQLKRFSGMEGRGGWAGKFCAGAVTFVAVATAWVLFRADSAASAWRIIKAMAGQSGFVFPEKFLVKFGWFAAWLQGAGVEFRAMNYFEGSTEVVHIAVALLIVFLAPNVQQMMNRFEPYLNIMGKGGRLPDAPSWLTFRPSAIWAFVLIACALASILYLSRAGEFIYFQF